MDAESAPNTDTVTPSPSSSIGTNLQQEVIHEGEVTNSTSNNASNAPPRRLSTARNRKKSRRLTLTQVCAEEAAQCADVDMPTTPSPDVTGSTVNLVGEVPMPSPLPPSVAAAAAAESSSGTRRGSRLSFSLASPERKMSKIFTMLQSMQQIFLQASLQPPTPPAAAGQQMTTTPTTTMAPAACHSPAAVSRVNSVTPSRVGKQTMLYGMGRSQDSLVVPNRLRNPVLDRLNRFGSINSWAGSEYSEASSACSGPPPPLVHAVPYHKDGWASFFIVGSSTYAQLVIVVCIVAALSEVVTHNVPFLFFEGFFTYLYGMSIVFFLYVFGYLLRSKRRKELKRRQRKISRWRTLPPSKSEDGLSSSPSGSISVRMEADSEPPSTPTPSAPLNRLLNSSLHGQRRRSIASSTSSSDLSNYAPLPPSPLVTGCSQSSNGHRGLHWTPSALSFNLVEESSSEAVSYAMNSANVVVSSSGSTGRVKKMKVSDNEHSHGSFFLRAGAVAFGLGTMVYDGLEFGAFLEVPSDSPCFAMLRGLNPVLHAVFTFLQMYFIFVSARLNIHKFKVVARFGLMHCLATNVCVWVRTLVRESLKEIKHHHAHEAAAAAAASQYDELKVEHGNVGVLHHVAEAIAAVAGGIVHTEKHASAVNSSLVHHFVNETVAKVVKRAASGAGTAPVEGSSLWELTGNVSCGQHIFLGDVIMDAAPFLYPFLIEYSLIGAAVLYVLWAHIGLNPKYKTDDSPNQDTGRWKSHTLRVDCLGSSKGLFMGLFFLTISLVCLILFFVFASQNQYRRLGLFLADAAHSTLLIVSLIAMAIGAYRARNLEFHADHTEELGNMLVRISALGIYAYSAFSIIAGALAQSSTDEPPILVMVNGILTVVEVTIEMLYISDLSRRRVSTSEQDRHKPGRQSVTFLLITNLTLWLVYTFEMQKVEANPVQLSFYGFMPWTIVQRMTLPLCIFYRFHLAIVYAEIWKNTYRFGHSNHGRVIVS